MLRVLLTFIILLASVLLGIQLSKDPGYVLITINHWIIESTVWVTAFGLLLLFILTYVVLQLIHKIAKTPVSLHEWRTKRLAQKARATTKKGLIEYSEGYWQKAKNHLIQAVPNTETPLLNYLTAARAAQKMGDSQLRDHYLREAQQSMPEAKIAVELTQAQLQLANHQWEQALATLRHLHDLAPKHPYVLKLLADLYKEVRDWPQLIDLLPSLKKNGVISEPVFEPFQKDTYLQYLIDLSKLNQMHTATELFNSLPKTLKNDPLLIKEYVCLLLKNQHNAKAESLLKYCLSKKFHPQLIEQYSLLPCGEKQLAFAESLLKKNPNSAALFLCLGRLCIAQHLWGKAKHYLEQSNKLHPTPAVYLELGLLHEELKEKELANQSYKKGLELATRTSTLELRGPTNTDFYDA